MRARRAAAESAAVGVESLAIAEVAAESAGAAAALDPLADAAQAATTGSNATAAARMREAGMMRLELRGSGDASLVYGPRTEPATDRVCTASAAMPCTGGD